MKRLKIPLLIVASLASLVLLAVLLAFTPGVQTWAVRRVLSGQPGLSLEVGHVAAGLTSAELRDVRVVQDGTIVSVKEITAAYSATDYLSGKKINVSKVVVRGVEVDARKPAAKPATPPAAAALAPFAGVLNAIKLPGEVRLGRLEVDAKVLLPDSQSAALKLEGGGIAPGQFGTLTWTVTFADSRKDAPLTGAQVNGEVKLRTTADLRVDAIDVVADAGVTGPGLPADRVKLNLKLEQPAANAGERIVARVSLVRGTAVEPLLNAQVDYAAGRPVLSGVWDLAVRSEQLAAALAGFGLPEVALAGKGSFTYNLESGAATTAGEVTGKISRLEKLGAELAAIGTLQVRTAFAGGSSKESAQLGRLEFEVAAEDGRKFVTVAAQQKLSFNFKDKRLTPERPGAELARVALIAVPLGWAQPVVKPRTITGDLSGVFVINAELDGSRVKLTTAEPLTLRAVTLKEGDKPLVDRLTLAVSPSVDYTPTRVIAELAKLALSTPDGDTVSGALNAEVALPAAGSTAKPVTAFTAQLQGRLVALTKPYLPAEVGPLTLSVNAKGRHDGGSVQIAALSTKIDREGGVALASVEALQPITLDLAKQSPSVPNAAAPALRVKWGEIPLVWAQGYVAKSTFAGQLAAGTLEVVMLGADAAEVRAVEAISARGVSVAMDNQPLLRDADFSTDLLATWKGGTLFADVKRLELKQGKTSVLTASVNGEATPPTAGKNKTLVAKGRGQVDADFSALAQQPALAAQLPVIRGSVSAKFEGTMNNGVDGKVTIAAKNLVARQGALALGSMDLGVEAKLDATNSGVVRIPLVVTKDNRRSDLLLEGKVGMKPGLVSFEGKVTGDQLIVDDLQAFSALSAPPPVDPKALTPPVAGPKPAPAPAPRPAAPGPSRVATTTSTAKPAGPVKDTTPVWAGFAGRIDVNLKSIKQGAANALTGFNGAFSAREDRLAVENISGQINGNPFKVIALLNFDLKQARPYALTGSVDLPRLDVGDILKKANPAEPPALETVVSLAAKFSGTALNLAELQDRAIGSFEFKGSKGVLRALNQKAQTASNTATAVSIGASLLGAALGGRAQGIGDKIAGGAADAAELARLLKDMPFDSVVIQGERVSDGTLALKSLEFLSPEVHLTGSGRVDMRPGVPLEKSPLALQLQLAGKNRVAGALDKLRQLDGRKDAKEFYLMQTPFSLSGTVEKPDSSEFWKSITLNTASSFLR